MPATAAPSVTAGCSLRLTASASAPPHSPADSAAIAPCAAVSADEHQLGGAAVEIERDVRHVDAHQRQGEHDEEAEERIKAMVRTTDGFELAEVDLELRGEGTVMGERQKGRNDLRLASLRRDKEWVEIARMEASEILIERDLASIKELAEEVTLFLGESEADYLLKS